MKKLTVALCIIAAFCLLGWQINKMNTTITAQTELLRLIYDDDPDTWDDVIAETDEYQNLVEVYDIGF